MKGAEGDVGRLEGSRGTIQVMMCAKVGDQKRLEMVATLCLRRRGSRKRGMDGALGGEGGVRAECVQILIQLTSRHLNNC